MGGVVGCVSADVTLLLHMFYLVAVRAGVLKKEDHEITVEGKMIKLRLISGTVSKVLNASF